MCSELDLGKILLGIWTLINIFATSWIPFFFNKRLKRFSLRFSYFSEMQLKSLADIYHLLAEFKEKTELMEQLELKNKNPETYKRKSLDLAELSNELNKFNVNGVFKKSIVSINSLLNEIEIEFDKIK